MRVRVCRDLGEWVRWEDGDWKEERVVVVGDEN